MELGEVCIDKIGLDPKSRDDIPAMWRVLVMAILKQGLRCDYDRVHELVNQHRTVREFLGHGTFDHVPYKYQRVVDNICLVRPELLVQVNRLVVESGHAVARKKPGAPLVGRCDSFVVETDVHYPTDVNLLWDAMRCLVRVTGRAASRHGLGGWRQWRHLLKRAEKLYRRVQRRAKFRAEQVEEYLEFCQVLAERAKGTLAELSAARSLSCLEVEGYLRHALRQIDQVERRIIKGETIPHNEKVFSIFEEHTRWVVKGKAGCPQELGVPVCVVGDQYGFILHHKIIWQGGGADVAVSMVKETQAMHPDLRVCSFDRGFHGPENRRRLDELLDCNALPRRGRLSKADLEREQSAPFAAARSQHPAIKSAIDHLEHRGLARVLSYGRGGFARSVALSVVAFNIHRIGLILQRQERKRLRHRRRRLAA